MSRVSRVCDGRMVAVRRRALCWVFENSRCASESWRGYQGHESPVLHSLQADSMVNLQAQPPRSRHWQTARLFGERAAPAALSASEAILSDFEPFRAIFYVFFFFGKVIFFLATSNLQPPRRPNLQASKPKWVKIPSLQPPKPPDSPSS